MGELLVVAFLGGLITGLSPCIVPVIPVVMAGGSAGTSRARPYVIIAGLVVSFSLSVLFASSLLSFLHLPQDLLFWLGVAMLGLLSVGLLISRRSARSLSAPSPGSAPLATPTEGGGFVLGLEPRPGLRALRRTGADRDLGGGRPPPGRARPRSSSRSSTRSVSPCRCSSWPWWPSAPRRRWSSLRSHLPDRPQGGRRRARRHDVGHRLQLARGPAARRPRLHHRARGPHRVDQFGLHPAAAPERRAPEPVRRGQRPAGGEEGDVRGDRRGQFAERAPGGRGDDDHDDDHRTPTSTSPQKPPVFMANKTNLPEPRPGARISRASRPGSTRRATSR